MATTTRTRPSSRMGRRIAGIALIAGLGSAAVAPAMAIDRSDAGQQAGQAALAAVGGTGQAVDIDRERSQWYTWEVEIRNGNEEIDVYLDQDLKVVTMSAWHVDDEYDRDGWDNDWNRDRYDGDTGWDQDQTSWDNHGDGNDRDWDDRDRDRDDWGWDDDRDDRDWDDD